MTSEQIAELVRIGRNRGYVLYDEIDRILAPGREAIAELDTVLTELAKNSIDVFDEPRTEESIPDASFFDGAEDLAPLRMYIHEVLKVPRLGPPEEKDLARQVQLGGQDAENAEKWLIEANLWIVLATATHYANRGVKWLDIIQEGNIGLMRAVKGYNHLRDYAFSTYAVWWVRVAIRRFLSEGLSQP